MQHTLHKLSTSVAELMKRAKCCGTFPELAETTEQKEKFILNEGCTNMVHTETSLTVAVLEIRIDICLAEVLCV